MLIISNNNLTKLPDFSQMNKLKILYCEKNYLIKLLNLPKNLKYLYCYNNRLKKIQNLSKLNKLYHLYCSNNKLIKLQNLPINLRVLNYDSNLIKFSTLPINLDIFVFSNNKLNFIIDFPKLYDFNFLSFIYSDYYNLHKNIYIYITYQKY